MFYYSDSLQRKVRSPHSRILGVEHQLGERSLIHSTYTVLLRRTDPKQGQFIGWKVKYPVRTIMQSEGIR